MAADDVFDDDATRLLPRPTLGFDEEHDNYGAPVYDEGLSRIDTAYQDPRPQREIPIPHIEDEDGSGYNVPGEGKSRSKARPLLAFLLVGVMLAGILAAGAYGFELWGGKSVPSVVGLSEARAVDALAAKGFQADVRERIADDAIGIVLEQDPSSGVRLSEGSYVTVVVAANRVMPDLVGRTEEEALDLLTKAGAVAVSVERENSTETEGTVLSVMPESGEPFTAHQTVTLVVARKPVVPDVMGKSKAEATTALENAGFKVDVTYVISDETPGTVVKQEPEANSKQDPGTKVSLSLSQAMPKSPLHLLEYFEKSSANIARYLPEQGFSRYSSHLGTDGFAEVAYLSNEQGELIFTERPFERSFDYDANTEEDVLGDGAKFVGIRWEVPESMLPAGSSTLDGSAIEELMKLCGLTNITDSCTHEDIVAPIKPDEEERQSPPGEPKDENDDPVEDVETEEEEVVYDEHGYGIVDDESEDETEGTTGGDESETDDKKKTDDEKKSEDEKKATPKKRFRCACGSSNGLTWTVIIVNDDGEVRAAVTAAQTSSYESWYDLSDFGDSICDMVAYYDVYAE